MQVEERSPKAVSFRAHCIFQLLQRKLRRVSKLKVVSINFIRRENRIHITTSDSIYHNLLFEIDLHHYRRRTGLAMISLVELDDPCFMFNDDQLLCQIFNGKYQLHFTNQSTLVNALIQAITRIPKLFKPDVVVDDEQIDCCEIQFSITCIRTVYSVDDLDVVNQLLLTLSN